MNICNFLKMMIISGIQYNVILEEDNDGSRPPSYTIFFGEYKSLYTKKETKYVVKKIPGNLFVTFKHLQATETLRKT